MSRRPWRMLIGSFVLATVLSVASMAWATVTGPTRVIGAVGNQIIPSATPGATFLAYASSRPGHPNQYDAYLKPAGQARIKINGRGQAYPGGFSGSTLIYQRVRNGQSDLGEIDTGTLAKSTPSDVNTPNWEWGPTISGDWILFGRIAPNGSQDRIMLHNVTTTRTRVLDVHTGQPFVLLTPGTVDGDWVAWDRWVPKTGADRIVRYQISTAQVFKVPTPTGKAQGAPTVDAAGDVFYVRHPQGVCGRRTSIRELTIGNVDQLLVTVPTGFTVGAMYAVDEGGGVTTVYYDQGRCAAKTSTWNIYKLVVS